MRKFLSFTVVLLLAALAFAVTASAAGSASLTASAAGAKVGETITFTLTLSGMEQGTSASVLMNYDANVFDYVSHEFLKTGAMLSNYDANNKAGALAFQSATDFNGNYFKITLRVKSASASAQNVSATVQVRGGSTVTATKSVKAECASHTFGAWTQKSAPSCGVKGSETRTCSVCGTAETRDVAALAHIWSAWKQTAAPGCETAGSESRTCSICQKTETRNVSAVGHKWGNYVVTKAPSCTEKGVETRTCSGCQKTETRDVSATGHSWGNWMQTKAPGCEEKGAETRACAKCDKKETRDVAALGHSFSSPQVTKAPTCTEEGVSTGTCTRCSKTTTQAVKALGHSWGDWETTTQADCELPGTQTRVCKNDASHTESRSVPALGHDFEDPQLVKEATLSEPGLMQGKCKRCGKTTDQVIPCSAADSATGIEVRADEGSFEKGTELKVEKIDNASGNHESVQNALADVSSTFEAFDLTATLGGTGMQPKKPVTVIFPVPSGFGNNTELYMIREDGTAEKVEAVLSDNGKEIRAVVDKLGRVALVDRASGSSGDQATDTPVPGTTTADVSTASNIRSTGENTTKSNSGNAGKIMLIVIAAVVVLALAAVGIVFGVRKKKNQ